MITSVTVTIVVTVELAEYPAGLEDEPVTAPTDVADVLLPEPYPPGPDGVAPVEMAPVETAPDDDDEPDTTCE